MKKTITRLLAVALAAISFNALAGLIDLRVSPNLDPSVPDTGFFAEQACPAFTGPPPGGQACPTGGASISGHDDIFFDIINSDGIMNISFIGSVTPSTGGVFSFVYTVFNPAAIPISSGLPQTPPDFNVVIGNGYKISLDWTLTSAVGSSPRSANFTMDATTAPALKVPEPMTLALIGIGVAGLGFARRRKLS